MGKLLKKAKARKAGKEAMNKANKKRNSFQKALANKLRDLKGKHFSWSFECDMCRVTHTNGYLYNVDNEEYQICKFCNDRIHQKNNYVRIIYTPMGNNQ